MALAAHSGLVREREAAINNIRLACDNAYRYGDNWTISTIEARQNILENYWARFQEAQRQLLLGYSNVRVIADTMTQVEQTTADTYVETKAELNRLMVVIRDAMPPPAKIPKVSEIRMSFTGKYLDWAGWRAEFQTKVLDTGLDASEKISLLMGALKNEAATCAGRAERLDQIELDRIWSKLERTYDNKYQQAYAHIMNILNIQPMNVASASKLRNIIDTTDESLRMLQRFGIQTEQWSPLVCVILLDKIDIETGNQWETKDHLPVVPDLVALFAHME